MVSIMEERKGNDRQGYSLVDGEALQRPGLGQE